MTKTIKTGLPPLPEGQFWRIRNTRLDMWWVNILCIMQWETRKRLWRKPKRVAYVVASMHLPEPFSAADVGRIALRLLQSEKDSTVQANLYGDYPPKVLE